MATDGENRLVVVDDPRLAHIGEFDRSLLRRWANQLSGYFGAPVYLCGSALRPDNPNPRDWDVRVTIPDTDFWYRFGGLPEDWIKQGETGDWGPVRWNWSRECVRNTKAGWSATGLNIDFQVYSEMSAKQYAGQPRVRLDTNPALAEAHDGDE